MTKNRSEPGTRWWGFVGYRRRYVSDRLWVGAGFIAASAGSLGAAPGWWKALDLAGLVVGVALAWSGIWRRRRHRGSTDAGTTEPR